MLYGRCTDSRGDVKVLISLRGISPANSVSDIVDAPEQRPLQSSIARGEMVSAEPMR